ncbi:PREDICTED: uncharacterized protein LOC109146755 [Ipomoea nil]|uniref:uncharacterized protein LOC109146755 n=1 Tax=Ipomoea nil TaxID=35883 RepID=UPI0009008CA3|nr:PREDICTED: uncharacterized protein LOC109146755 [Ipomoea nil]
MVTYIQSSGETTYVHRDPVLLIPVLGHPLSSNRYYAIKPDGTHKGEAFTCSTEEDKTTCCFWRCVKDVRPKPLDPHNMYQQFEVSVRVSCCNNSKGSFDAKSMAPDGFPPYFLRRKGGGIEAKTCKNYRLEEALGLDVSLRKRLPELNIPPSEEAVVVGKWYCPFVFIKDGTLKDHMERSAFYEMTLEQRWEQIFTCQNNDRNEGISSVLVDTVLDKEVLISGSKAKWDESIENGVIWFKRFNAETEETSVGLRQEIVEQMKWEQERGGWSGGEKELKVKRREEYGEFGGWREFCCYILVERFVLKRMDGSLVITYSFRHSDKIKSIWM